MSGFKLIAIRPLIGCNKKFLKNLKEGQIYKFYKDFLFLDIDNLSIDEFPNENDVEKIEQSTIIHEDLYNLNISNLNTINVNISAVVGKNGSGKSTIVELISLFVFCLSTKLDLINIEDFKKNHFLNKDDVKRLQLELDSFKSFNCEIYYLLDDTIYSITKENNDFIYKIFKKTEYFEKKREIFFLTYNEKIQFTKDTHEPKTIEFLRESFFYSILANYSLYGLNTNELGIWLKSIFHKNDGYQTPIVLNPMRTEGIIDINRLTYLSKSRLLSNVFRKPQKEQKDKDSLRNLVNNKIVDKIILKLDINKFSIIDPENLKTDQLSEFVINIGEKSIYLEYMQKYRDNHFKHLITAFYPKYSNLHIVDSYLKKITIEYILRKAFDIIKTYPEYKIYSKRVFRSNSRQDIIIQCFERLATDFTHSTFKIRQAINFLIHNFYDLKSTNKEYFLSTESGEGIADIINENIENFIDEDDAKLKEDLKIYDNVDYDLNKEIIYKKHSLINYLPPSFFEIDFEFRNSGFFKDLSSGEKQMIYSINSIIYHLFNLKSIESDERITYKYYNIILDEIELCFHPEFQRVFIYELLRSINASNMIIYGLNVIFLTHSPFILSDIPSANILRLNNGNILLSDEETFGSNIHDLLANDFFLENGFMGEYTKNEINNVIEHLNFLKIENKIFFLKKQLSSSSESKKESIKIELKKIDSKAHKRKFKIHNILNSKYNSDYCQRLIELVGEPLLKDSLNELFIQAYPLEKEDFIQNQIDKLFKLKSKINDSNSF